MGTDSLALALAQFIEWYAVRVELIEVTKKKQILVEGWHVRFHLCCK